MLSHVQLFETSCTVALQAPMCLEVYRQEYWSRLPCPSPGDLPHPGLEPVSPVSPASRADSLPLSQWGNPYLRALSINCKGFPDSSVGKESTCNAGDPGLIPGSGRSPWRRDRLPTPVFLGFPCGSAGKESACNVGDLDNV